jgi:integrase
MAVKVRERPSGSGKWWVFTDWKGKRSARLIPQGKRTADQIAAKITEKLALLEANERNGFPISLRSLVFDKTQTNAPKEPASKVPLFKDYATHWLETCEARGLKHTTYQAYKFIVDGHLKPCFGELPLSEIDRKGVKEFALERRKVGVAPRTIIHILCGLSAIFNAAIDDELVSHNPALKPGRFLKGVKKKHEDVNPLTLDEEQAFLRVIQEHYPRYYPLFLLFLRTGLRLGEAVALQPGDLDFRGRFIEIRRNWTRGRLTSPKNGKTRRVDMSLKLTQVLKDHLVSRELEAMAQNRQKTEWLFTNELGDMMDPDNLRNRIFYKSLARAELRKIRIHDLRHTYATRLITNGESLAYVKEQMGHSSIQVTVDIYHHYVQGSNKQAVDRLDETVDNPKTEDESATIRNHEETVRWERSGFSQNLLRKLEPAIRIERTTCGLRNRCSTN